jgi:hypothetical protein
VRLDKLRGFGPWLAFAVPVLFVLAIVVMVIITASISFTGTGSTRHAVLPTWFAFGVAAWLLVMALWMLCSLAVAIDLEWIEHPLTHTGLTYAGLVAMVVATIAFLGILLEGVLNVQGGFIVGLTGFLFFAGFGVYLVLMNWVGMQAGLLGRVLPVLGIIAGVFFLLPAISVFVSIAGILGIALLPALLLYLVWSPWLGFRLRGKAPAGATA